MASILKLLTVSAAIVACEARIDTHHHAIPPAYAAAIEAAGGDGSGFPSPEWSIDASVDSLTKVGTSLGK
jgi:6-methylsalicylate decarboxylase